MSAMKQGTVRRKSHTLRSVGFDQADKCVALTSRLKRPPPSRMLNVALPKRVLSLDIETTSCKKTPEKNEIAIVGVKVFVRKLASYVPDSYTVYRSSELKMLERKLRRFRGLIIGHNILGFDYRVLRTAISLDGVVEKTVDTLLLARQRTKSRTSRLSLDELAWQNLRTKKLMSGKQIPVVWKQGKEKFVIRYNEKDCDLTMRIWQHIVERGYLAAPDSQRGAEFLKFTDDDAPVLGGQSPMITYENWLGEADTGGKVFKRQPLVMRFVDDTALQPDSFKIFNRINCAACAKNFILISDVRRIFGSGDISECPHCTAQVPLLKVQHGVLDGDAVQVLGASKLAFVAFSRPGEPEDFPAEPEARAWLGKVRKGPWM